MGVVSIASCEAPDTRSCEREVSRESLPAKDEAFAPTSPEVDGAAFGPELRRLLPAPAGAGEGEAALTAPTVGAAGGPAGSLRVAQAATED